MQSRAHEIIAGHRYPVDPERGNVVLDLGKGGSAVLPRNEQVPGETFTEGQTCRSMSWMCWQRTAAPA